jgi:hypothetical protein
LVLTQLGAPVAVFGKVDPIPNPTSILEKKSAINDSPSSPMTRKSRSPLRRAI